MGLDPFGGAKMGRDIVEESSARDLDVQIGDSIAGIRLPKLCFNRGREREGKREKFNQGKSSNDEKFSRPPCCLSIFLFFKKTKSHKRHVIGTAKSASITAVRLRSNDSDDKFSAEEELSF